MQDNSYRYLFPYEKIPPSSHILIYGAGMLGQEYLKQMLITGYCHVVGFADKNFADYPSMIVPVYSPQEIHHIDFDFVVVAIRVEFALNEIKALLVEEGVDESKIVYIFERMNIEHGIFVDTSNDGSDEQPTPDTTKGAFALYLGGGIGDMLNHKRFVMELVRLVPDAVIDIYSVRNIEFLSWLFSDIPTIRNVIPDLGVRYISKREKYSLAITVIASFMLQVDWVSSEDFVNQYPDFLKRIYRLKERTEEEALSLQIPNGVAYHRRMYEGTTCYTWFNYGDVFDIDDYHVTIPYSKADEDAFQKLQLTQYITFNAGNGACRDGNKVAKSWPYERFVKTLTLFRERYPEIAIIQIGATDEEKANIADVHFMGQDFGIVSQVLKHAIFHLDIEGGLVHLASQIGTKCIVLFGPTSSAYNAYESNVNIKVGDCHDCYALYMDAGRCARHMKKPACMYAITPEIVMGEIEKYMLTLNVGAQDFDS